MRGSISHRTPEALLVGAEEVMVIIDDSQPERDRYGRILGYITHHGTDLGAQMIHDGHATELTIRRLHDRADQYGAAEAHARNNRIGMWDICALW